VGGAVAAPDRVGNTTCPAGRGNGLPPWGWRGPGGAAGNLFFKGWLNLLLGLHRYVSGDDKWNAEFWSPASTTPSSLAARAVNALLVEQWTARPEGPHCENTKIWPYCLSRPDSA